MESTRLDPPAPSTMKLFIVEDSISILERIVRSISDVPNMSIVGSAIDVAPAIEALKEKRPDALLLDMQLPGGSGLEVLRKVRPSLPDMQVVVFTNFADEPYRRAAMEAGAQEFLDKNADFPKVREILTRWSTAQRCPNNQSLMHAPRTGA